ncbi:SDR family NAD(P)-dependent oxidoreductase [Streptomyces sp. SD15]
MTSWTANDLPNLTGRTVVITGAGRGLGLITARELARARARVVLGVRDTGKARRAVADLPGTFDVRPLDVSDLTSVRDFADSWSGDIDRPRLDARRAAPDGAGRHRRSSGRSVARPPGVRPRVG